MKKTLIAWKRFILPYVIAYGLKYIANLLIRTCRIKITGLDQFLVTAKQSPCILMLWHDRLVVMPEVLSRHAYSVSFTAMISKSRDADILAHIVNSYSIGEVLRIPHNQRYEALNQMVHILKQAKRVVIITPDGPRGPRHVLKPGIAIAARESSSKIIHFSWKASRYWELNTWDKMQIPKPFSTIKVTFGKSIALPNREELNVQKDLDYIYQELSDVSNS